MDGLDTWVLSAVANSPTRSAAAARESGVEVKNESGEMEVRYKKKKGGGGVSGGEIAPAPALGQPHPAKFSGYRQPASEGNMLHSWLPISTLSTQPNESHPGKIWISLSHPPLSSQANAS